MVAAGTPAQRVAALTSDADIIVIGRDTLGDALPYAPKFRTLILDELSGFKSRSSLRWKAARKLVATPNIDNVWGLTGTPSPNGLGDLWAQVFLLDGGARLCRTLTAFRDRFFVPGRQLSNGVITEWNLRPGADIAIHSLIDDICLSMETDGRIVLPPVTYNRVVVPLPEPARQLYRRMARDLVADLDMLGGEVHTAVNAAALSSKLSQISAGFMYVDDAQFRDMAYDRIHSEKVRAILEIVEGTGSPVLVFYRFKAERDMLQQALGAIAHTIDAPDAIERWNRGELPVLLAHPASAGHGLNLQSGGHTIVWASLPWELELHEQANKRLARQGQKHPVLIHYLLSPNTVDSAILDRLRTKKSVQDALLAHLESPL